MTLVSSTLHHHLCSRVPFHNSAPNHRHAVYDVGCGDGRVLIQMASRSIPLDSNAEHSSVNQQQQWHHCRRFVGIEISPPRAQEARENIERAKRDGALPSHVDIDIRVDNALNVDYTEATVVFLYLVPRGLRLIRPVLWDESDADDANVADGSTGKDANNLESKDANHNVQHINLQQTQQQTIPRRIISYMNPIEGESIVKKEYCKVGNVEGAAFPIYLYHIL